MIGFAARMLAMRLVVVVLPCVPAMATPFFMRISSANMTARGTTGDQLRVGGDHLGVVFLDGGPT